MSLEATVIVCDNSEHNRSGDYAPTRFQAQQDAVNLLAGAKTQANPESTVGVLSMAGKTPRVLVTPTPDLGKVLNSMASLEVEGEAHFAAAVQIAQLALKHRQNKNQRQRIVIFVGSPLAESEKDLVKIAKKLKKNNVAVDVVSFGNEENDNGAKLAAFVDAVNSSDNSHLVSVPPGTILSDQLFGSPIYQQDGGAGYGGGGGAAAGGEGGEAGGFEFGVDANLDPELALALRVSLEEERARQQASGEGAAAEGGAAGGEGATAVTGGAASVAADGAAEPTDEDALLQQALAMSMDVDAPADAAVLATPAATSAPTATPAAPARAAAPPPASTAAAASQQQPEQQPLLGGGGDADMMEGIEDPELVAALAMSMSDFAGGSGAGETNVAGNGEAAAGGLAAAPATSAAQGEEANLLGDAEYLRSVLGSLPGVNLDDPGLQSTLRDLQGGKKEDGKEAEKEEDN